MKKTLFHLLPVLLCALFIYGPAFAKNAELIPLIRKQGSSETQDFQPVKRENFRLAISIHHTGSTIHPSKSSLSLDMKRLKRETEMELLPRNADESIGSRHIIAVFKMAFDELTYFNEFKRFLDGVETKVDNYRRKLMLKGEFGHSEQSPTLTSYSTGGNTKNTHTSNSKSFFLNLMPEKISWHLSSNLGSNYLEGELELGNHFVIQGNWGSDSDVKAMFSFTF